MKEHWKLVKPRAGSSPIFALSSHTTFSQNQTGATTPLNTIPSNVYCDEWKPTSSTTKEDKSRETLQIILEYRTVPSIQYSI